MADEQPLLVLDGVSKVYGRTVALDNASMSISSGRIHGLVGSNGAGKSTMIKIISGLEPATAGTMRLHGEEVVWKAPRQANAAGIGTAHQHVEVAGDLSALENVFLAEGGWRRRDPELYQRYRTLQDLVGCRDIPADIPVKRLGVAQRQQVAIMRALSAHTTPELVILDEPTAPLALNERSKLFESMRNLADRGIAVVFVSHFLDEILSVTDEITVLRDGRVVESVATSEVDEDGLVELIVGHQLYEVEHQAGIQRRHDPATVLSVQDLRLYPDSEPFSFEVKEGEVVGIAGLVGSGRSRLLHTLFGAEKPGAGRLSLNGESYPRSPAQAVRAGISLVPEERDTQGLMKAWELWRNVSLPSLARLARRRMITRQQAEEDLGRWAIETLSIRTDSPRSLVSRLSGGNAQKVVVAKWMAISPRLLLLDDPVVGVDVAAKADILQSVRDLAEKGCAVVVVSSDFDELLAVSTRILIQRHGVITTEVPVAGLTKLDLVALSGGVATGERDGAA